MTEKQKFVAQIEKQLNEVFDLEKRARAIRTELEDIYTGLDHDDKGDTPATDWNIRLEDLMNGIDNYWCDDLDPKIIKPLFEELKECVK